MLKSRSKVQITNFIEQSFHIMGEEKVSNLIINTKIKVLQNEKKSKCFLSFISLLNLLIDYGLGQFVNL